MPTECGAQHPTFGVTCQSARDHTDDHRHASGSGTVVWPRVEVKQELTLKQIKAKMTNHRAALKASMENIEGVHSAPTEALHTVFPIFVEQLDILEAVLDQVEQAK